MIDEYKRIEWIDCLKLLLVFAVYIGHLGTAAGRLYTIVWYYHVPALFFASGLVFKMKSNKYSNYVAHKFCNIMIPYYFFLIISVGMYSLITSCKLDDSLNQILYGFFGMKILSWGEPLWFLPTIFGVTIFYNGLFRIVKNEYIILFISFLFHYISGELLQYAFALYMPYCIIHVLYYLMWYSLGVVLKKYVNKMSLVCGTVSVIYFVLLFYGIDLLMPFSSFASAYILSFVKILLLIMAQIIFAKTLSVLPNINVLGKDTLFICGNEVIVKNILPIILSLFGLNLSVSGELNAIVYCILLFCFTNFFIIPFEKPFIIEMQNKIKKYLKYSNGVDIQNE